MKHKTHTHILCTHTHALAHTHSDICKYSHTLAPTHTHTHTHTCTYYMHANESAHRHTDADTQCKHSLTHSRKHHPTNTLSHTYAYLLYILHSICIQINTHALVHTSGRALILSIKHEYVLRTHTQTRLIAYLNKYILLYTRIHAHMNTHIHILYTRAHNHSDTQLINTPVQAQTHVHEHMCLFTHKQRCTYTNTR